MDKNIRKFITLGSLVLLLIITLVLVLAYFYKYSTLRFYNTLLLVFMGVALAASMILAITMVAFFYAYQKKKVSKGMIWALWLGLKVTVPFILSLSKLIQMDKDQLRKTYIDVNNIYIEGVQPTFLPKDILILVPHCLQNSECGLKVTRDAGLCVCCGKCNLGEILMLSREKGVKFQVVTGGTAARNVIKKLQPKMILSVACERDLLSGIWDVGNLPVIGVVNQRPQGPCFNTFVNMDELRSKLEILVKKS